MITVTRTFTVAPEPRTVIDYLKGTVLFGQGEAVGEVGIPHRDVDQRVGDGCSSDLEYVLGVVMRVVDVC